MPRKDRNFSTKGIGKTRLGSRVIRPATAPVTGGRSKKQRGGGTRKR
jgi:hypothetical protein